MSVLLPPLPPLPSTSPVQKQKKVLGVRGAVMLSLMSALWGGTAVHKHHEKMSALPNKPEITYNSGEQFFTAFNTAIAQPRGGETNPTQDTFDNAYDFIRKNSEYGRALRTLALESQIKTFDIDGVTYTVSADYTSGEYMFSISWTSEKTNESGEKYGGKYVFRRTGEKGDILFTDGDLDERTVTAEELKKLLNQF